MRRSEKLTITIGKPRPIRTTRWSRCISPAAPRATGRTFLVRMIAMFIALAGGAAMPTLAAAQSEPISIREFEAAKGKWSQRVGLPLRLEGRYTVLSANDIKFAGSDVRFLLPEKFVRPRGEFRNLEVSGHLEKRDGEFVFIVRNLKVRPTDQESLGQMRATIDTGDPEAFYELAQWARDRGKFYEDAELLEAANGLFERGLTREFELLERSNAEGMRAVAEKAHSFGLSDRLSLQYLHEANRAAFKYETQQPEPNYQPLLRHISSELPGSRTPLPAEMESLRSDYLKAPLVAYRIADSGTRRLFDRIFYGEVVLTDVEQSAAPDGSNGDAIAARIEKQIPERADVATSYRDRQSAYLSGRATELSRENLLALVHRYEERGQLEPAADVKRRWLAAREEQAKSAGPTRMMEVGEDYLNLLGDERAAARLFRMAYESNPQLAAADWLGDHGYELQGGRWIRPGESGDEDRNELNEAIREGRVLEGMSGSQVRAALGGAPSSIVRIASAGQISEIWLYEELRVSVQLSRRSHQQELSVRRVTDAP